ncbi:MAG: aminopeptidase P family N-terminal domain-containing protein, partial [Burkholderiales bacterium]|nr:aminopeptidase P family N-terminal domain-containing protein [Burkholderiales bacterium]
MILTTSVYAKRISNLAKLLPSLGLTAFIFPTADPHLSEYVSDAYASRKWLSGFTGSAGTLAIDQSGKAALVTDSRYWEQAARQISGTTIELIKATGPFYPAISDWLGHHLKSGDIVGICGRFISEEDFSDLQSSLEDFGIKLKNYPSDITTRLPSYVCRPTHNSIYEHEISPRSRQEKFKLLKDELEKSKAQRVVLTSLEDIAWLTNLRGSDIPCSPLFYSFAIFDTKEGLDLFLNLEAVSSKIKTKLESEGIRLHPYQDIANQLATLESGCTIADSKAISKALLDAIPKTVDKSNSPNPVTLLKAQKSKEELDLIRKAMEKDGVALVKFFKWLEENVGSGTLTELSCAEKLLEFRKQEEGFISPSFETICAFGPNAALPHYKATEDSYSEIKGDGFLLIDSGAQFPEGTTDITRTMLIGAGTEAMKKDYTAVLRGNIRLAMSIFPDNVPAQVLDVLARAPIWKDYVDYGHGTGHGVGFFLGVHEGPLRISYPR